MDKQIINKYVDLSNIKLVEHGNNKGKFNWENSIGCLIPFKFKDIEGVFEIIDYSNGINKTLILKYQNKILPKINIASLKSCKLSNTLKDYLLKWKYNIGDKVCDIIIIDRKYFRKNKDIQKYYKIQCDKCSFKSGEYFKNGVLKNEYWMKESDLSKKGSCPCCSSKIVVEGINDIPTIAPWMVKYFQDGYNEAKLYTCQSNKKIYFKCPDCDEIKTNPITICSLYKTHSLSCLCSDKVSYPNKFSYNVFKQINNQFNFYAREYSPKWLSPCRYDHYFELKNGHKYVVEMDGLIGHGNFKWRSFEIDEDSLIRDKLKDKLANEHNIKVIRVNCEKSDMNFIKNNIIDELSNILDFSKIDWKKVEEFSLKNTIKEVCSFYNNISISFKEISKEYNISSKTIMEYLKKGRVLGWCNYETLYETKDKNIIIASKIKKDNPMFTSADISKLMNNISRTAVQRYLEKGNELNLCIYNKDLEIQNRICKAVKNATDKTSKIVFVYDLQGNYINTYKSVNELERQSLKDFGVHLNARNISQVCLGQRKTHKGFTYSYVEKIA